LHAAPAPDKIFDAVPLISALAAPALALLVKKSFDNFLWFYTIKTVPYRYVQWKSEKVIFKKPKKTFWRFYIPVPVLFNMFS
jgi:hypothetical protein